VGATTLRVTYNTEEAKSLGGLVNKVVHTIRSYTEKANLDLFRTTLTLDDGSVIKCVFVHGAVIVDVNKPSFGVSDKVEKVITEIIFYKFGIDLIASEDKRFYVSLVLGKDDYKIGKDILARPQNDYTISDEYYIAPLYDFIRENCPSITKVGGVQYVTVAPDNVELAPVDKWDDWHWHKYYFDGTPDGYEMSEELYRPPSKVTSDSGATHFSMLSNTAFRDHEIVSRYIDQTKRQYAPAKMVTSAGAEDMESISNSMYGRNPYTLDSKGNITSKLERVTLGSVVTPVVTEGISAIQFFWPFIPYLDEIGHLNLLAFTRGSDAKVTPDLESMVSWKLHYLDASDVDQNIELYSDSATFTGGVPTGESTNSNEPTTCLCAVAGVETFGGYICGTGTIIYTTDSSVSYNSTGTKYVPIGTGGSLKTLHVKNNWVIAGTGPIANANTTYVTTGNLPVVFHLIGQYIDTWPGIFGICDYRNDNTTDETYTETASNSISITQELKFGDDVIATGLTTMQYSMSYAEERHYNGYWEIKLDGCSAGTCTGSIGYTTTQMSTSGTQTLTVVDAVSGATYTWAITSGGGSLSTDTGTSTVYTAPATNANCSNNPTISLSCEIAAVGCVAGSAATVIDTLEIAVNAYTAGSAIGRKCIITNIGYCALGYGGLWYWYALAGSAYALSCNGSESLSATTTKGSAGNATCSTSQAYAEAQALSALGCATWDTWTDLRSAADKANGCCPAQLM
jgi:hypothetical protein